MALASSPNVLLMPVQRTVYLVRHGEAMHNIEERHAKKRASEEAERLGYAKISEAHKSMCEAARVAVLQNEEFRDAPLSETGVRDAVICEEALQKLVKTLDLQQPGEVLVSPLQRTLQTAAAMFPNHDRTRVCELLRERRTGRPCDDCMPSTAKDPSFASMDWISLTNSDDNSDEDDGQGFLVEDVTMLRRRAGKLAKVLYGCSEETICIIAHKGYLRELERGPFERPAATEFGNCEVRVYHIKLPGDGTMAASLHYCKGVTSPEPEPPCREVAVHLTKSSEIDSSAKGSMTANACTPGLSSAAATTSNQQSTHWLQTMQYDLQMGYNSASTELPEKEIVACF